MAVTKKATTKAKDSAKSNRQTDNAISDVVGKSALNFFGFRWMDGASMRETVESIVIAFLLAFLFRTFEAEAFVIPTGSMAPTLMGQHKDLECEACKFPYKVSASSEDARRAQIVRSGVCPNCGFRMDVDQLPTYAGDRLLVNKFSYELDEPRRWDVTVFKFPGRAKNNYIKRLIGLPNETIVIKHGDIYTGANPLPADGKTEIQRKPPDKVRAMLQVVYDNDYVLTNWIKAGWPACWAAADDKAAQGWTPAEDHKSFSVDRKEDERNWLRYRNITLNPDIWRGAWRDFQADKLTEADLRMAQAKGVQDVYAYNNGLPQMSSPSVPNWVGDLAVELELTTEDKNGDVILQLVKGGRLFECRFDLANGSAELSIPGLESYKPKAQNAWGSAKTHRVMFANVDEQLLLWIDDNLVKFDAQTSYDSLNNYVETATDGSPVGIAVQGSAARVTHLRVLRDLYYIDTGRGAGPMPLHDDQFLMLGDNSPQSSDSRLWPCLDTDGNVLLDSSGNEIYYVHRDLLIGKAVYIYWPHAWVPDWAWPVRVRGHEIRVPFYPNFWRMGLVR